MVTVETLIQMPRRKFQRAGTLLDVLLALSIIGGGLMAFGALMPTAARTGSMVGKYEQASSLVQHKIDQLRAVGYGRLNYTELRSAGIIDEEPLTQPYSFKIVDNLQDIFPEPEATISIIDETSNIRRVTVTLRWRGGGFVQGSGQLQGVALIAR